jgi:predicted nucleic acid-binding protein
VSRVLFDSDVLLDVLLERQPHVAGSAAALEVVAQGKDEGLVAGHAVANMSYVLRRQAGDSRSRHLLTGVLAKLTVAPVTDRAIRTALGSSFNDFEDGLSHAVALEAGLDAIVTRNTSDFAAAAVAVLTPVAYVALSRASSSPSDNGADTNRP